jgi:hypothetical protein
VRRITLVLGLAMLLALMAAGTAMAVTKTCANNPCNGTDNDDTLYERIGTKADTVRGMGGEDVIDANTFNFDGDRLLGGARGDKLLVNDGDDRDVVRGGGGRDVCYVDPGDRAVNCEVVRESDTDTVGRSDVPQDLSRAAF